MGRAGTRNTAGQPWYFYYPRDLLLRAESRSQLADRAELDASPMGSPLHHLIRSLLPLLGSLRMLLKAKARAARQAAIQKSVCSRAAFLSSFSESHLSLAFVPCRNEVVFASPDCSHLVPAYEFPFALWFPWAGSVSSGLLCAMLRTICQLTLCCPPRWPSSSRACPCDHSAAPASTVAATLLHLRSQLCTISCPSRLSFAHRHGPTSSSLATSRVLVPVLSQPIAPCIAFLACSRPYAAAPSSRYPDQRAQYV